MTAFLIESSLRGSWRPHLIKVTFFFCLARKKLFSRKFNSSSMGLLFLLSYYWVSDFHCVLFLFMAVTTVDSGSKALEFLGFHEDDQINPDSPSIFPNTHQVLWFSWFSSCLSPNFFPFLSTFCIIFLSAFLKNLLFFCCCFAGSGSESYYYRLLYARHDRLRSAKENQGMVFIFIFIFRFLFVSRLKI